ncbi:YceI family protein [Pseudobacteriovorax antillogorgiicola]|uniref:YceI-like domain-containing protein n=1 Tax=Pseudobacteriovorax antillogorgiicola TaxID=1513793 RepID=A0A1Y6CV91_9BACT|nr:YceI family protein [Pseudobacteriovorax antillogorgiicola]TCS44819.1 YceI-like domain-containing protein [Pseudobacteriovorax antillogorgiicola]SMF77244.1 YceI-like domain-containing protein [Pseudobacteriovorax antillogorgiicola]
MGVLSKLVLISMLIGQVAMAELKWPQETPAAAWEAKKTMFLVSSSQPVGMNNAITVRLEQKGDGEAITVQIPVDKFDSDEPDRDKDVAQILGGGSLRFTSQAFNQAAWQDLEKGTTKKISGTLTIGKESFPVEFDIKVTNESGKTVLVGSTESTLSAFKIEPPSVAGGLVASVDDYIKLHVRLFLDELKPN